MSSAELLCQEIGVNPHKLSKEENFILEAVLFTRICDELKEIFIKQYIDFFHSIKCNAEMENNMIESRLVRCVINDILSTGEYNMTGIACYTQTPEEVVCDIAIGLNTSPSAVFMRKVIELHKSIRRELYQVLMKKVATEYLMAG